MPDAITNNPLPRYQSLEALYARHHGKLAHKWSGYLTHYERNLAAWRDKPCQMLEIGVQNGGSLEIWADYFPIAQKIVGVDVDQRCAQLQFPDPRISLVVADACSPDGCARVTDICPEFDLVLDDGSHRSGDIVRAFCRYFPKIKEGGLYAAEDLHCSYWQEYEGGLFDPRSSQTFFKHLADLVNSEHWAAPVPKRNLLRDILEHYHADLSDADIDSIQSVEFANSLCFVRKASCSRNLLGPRLIAGSSALVNADPLTQLPTHSTPLNQIDNPWSQFAHPPADELMHLYHRFGISDPAALRSNNLVRAITEQNDLLRSRVDEVERSIDSLKSSASWKITAPFRLARWLFERGPSDVLSAVRAYCALPKSWDSNEYVTSNWNRISTLWRRFPRLHFILLGDSLAPRDSRLAALRQPELPLIVNHPELTVDRDVVLDRGFCSVKPPVNRQTFFSLVPEKSGLGLEIGPLHTPICVKPQHNVRYLDVFSTEDLRRNYANDPNINVDDIVPVDLIDRGIPYGELTLERFDYVVSSHNVEHVPCLVTFLQNLESCLKPGGKIFLALPDKRYCFDHFKPESSIAEVIDAYHCRRKKPTPVAILRHMLLQGHNDAKRHWRGDHGLPAIRSGSNTQNKTAIEEMDALYSQERYIDTHVWILTPGFFAETIETLRLQGLIKLEMQTLYPTNVGSHEFYSILKMPG